VCQPSGASVLRRVGGWHARPACTPDGWHHRCRGPWSCTTRLSTDRPVMLRFSCQPSGPLFESRSPPLLRRAQGAASPRGVPSRRLALCRQRVTSPPNHPPLCPTIPEPSPSGSAAHRASTALNDPTRRVSSGAGVTAAGQSALLFRGSLRRRFVPRALPSGWGHPALSI